MDRVRRLFIGGAQRSGTTLLMRLMDGHPELLIFPMEHDTTERYVFHEHDRERYFREAFILERSEGQQTILAHADLYQTYRARMEREFEIDFTLQVDHQRFREGYRERLGDQPVTLGNVLHALMHGLARSSPYFAGFYEAGAYHVFKKPYDTVLFARCIAEEIPDARFLHIVRDPYARYASSKKRRVKSAGGVCPRANGRDFVTSFAETSVSALCLGLENQAALGTDRYRIMRFEDLIADVPRSMDLLAEWLGIEKNSVSYTPSLMGRPVDSGSSFKTRQGVDRAAAARSDQYEAITTPAERQLYRYYLGLSRYDELYELGDTALEGFYRRWWRPFKHERLRDYAWRLATRRAWPGSDAQRTEYELQHRLPELIVREGRRGRNVSRL